jgi:signal transduction histidine kinase
MSATEYIEPALRKTGIDALGDVPWGTHFCLFYNNKQDLIDVLVPYFKAGLENNEFCMWITSEPLNQKNAESAIRKVIPDFDEYLKKGQIEILPYDEWYLKQGSFNWQRVKQGWIDKLSQALTMDYAGIRITGNTVWIKKGLWRDFTDYEHQINESIGRYRIIALCAYCLEKCSPSEIIDVVNNHQLALIKENGKWTLTKNAERKRAEQRAFEYQQQLRSLVSELSLTEERERHRIATELQERINQSLAISKIKLDALRHTISGKELNRALDEICTTLGKSIGDVRSLVFDVSSPILYELGFETAVADWLTTEISQKHAIATEFEDDGQKKPLDKDIRVLLFRDVRELLTNVVNHAQAKKVKVSVLRVNDQIRVIVEDDGIGFDPSEVASRTGSKAGFGLFSIRVRLVELGGRLEIESTVGQGSKITMTAPLKMERIGNGDRG